MAPLNNMNNLQWKVIDDLLEEMVNEQRNKLLTFGRRVIPTLTPEDMLQPNDYPALENHPHFRYEEGILAGLQSSQIAFRSLKNSNDMH